MDEMTRRDVLRSAAIAGASATMAAAAADQRTEPEKIAGQRTEAEEADRQRVLACGMTEAEAEAWELLNRAAGKILRLPRLHPMEDHEDAHAIHVVQQRLQSRPFYRKYIEMAKAQSK